VKETRRRLHQVLKRTASVGLITQDNTTRAIKYTLSCNINKLKDGIRTSEDRLLKR